MDMCALNNYIKNELLVIYVMRDFFVVDYSIIVPIDENVVEFRGRRI